MVQTLYLSLLVVVNVKSNINFSLMFFAPLPLYFGFLPRQTLGFWVPRLFCTLYGRHLSLVLQWRAMFTLTLKISLLVERWVIALSCSVWSYYLSGGRCLVYRCHLVGLTYPCLSAKCKPIDPAIRLLCQVRGRSAGTPNCPAQWCWMMAYVSCHYLILWVGLAYKRIGLAYLLKDKFGLWWGHAKPNC